MAWTGELTERKAAILDALVRQYIRTGEPVGSEAVAVASGLGVSSATIRGELVSLEELGYLTQPHTSAGRAPTDLAYRFFVDSLPTRPRMRDAERRSVVHFFEDVLADVDEILRGTTVLLSRLTRYASLALAPTLTEAAIARAELIGLGGSTLLLVVFETGRVEKVLVEVPPELAEAELDRVSRTLADLVRGKNAKAAREALTERSTTVAAHERRLLERVAQALVSIEETARAEHVLLGGVSNIAADEAFEGRETLRHVYEALERESAMLLLLREAASMPPVSVTIGRENPLPGMWEASLIAAPYTAGRGAVGTIGVIGPIRMDYQSAISAVRVVAERLSAAVEALRG